MVKWKRDPKSYHLEMRFCPSCFQRLDAATNLTADAKPEPLDFTVCTRCASVLRFDDDMNLELSSLEAIPTHSRMAFARVVQVLKLHPFPKRDDDGPIKIA
jgi:hypothetical protein